MGNRMQNAGKNWKRNLLWCWLRIGSLGRLHNSWISTICIPNIVYFMWTWWQWFMTSFYRGLSTTIPSSRYASFNAMILYFHSHVTMGVWYICTFCYPYVLEREREMRSFKTLNKSIKTCHSMYALRIKIYLFIWDTRRSRRNKQFWKRILSCCEYNFRLSLIFCCCYYFLNVFCCCCDAMLCSYDANVEVLKFYTICCFIPVPFILISMKCDKNTKPHATICLKCCDVLELVGSFTGIDPSVVHVNRLREKIDFRLKVLRTHPTLYSRRIPTLVPATTKKQQQQQH